MKTNTPFIFMVSFLLLGSAVALSWYVREEINQKVETVRAHYLEEKQNTNLEFGNQLKLNSGVLDSQEKIVRGTFLDAGEVVGFITEMESIAQSQGLQISVEKVEHGTGELVAETHTIQPVTFNVQLAGSYQQIRSFLVTISSLEKILVTKELKLYRGGENEADFTARITIEGTAISQ